MPCHTDKENVDTAWQFLFCSLLFPLCKESRKDVHKKGRQAPQISPQNKLNILAIQPFSEVKLKHGLRNLGSYFFFIIIFLGGGGAINSQYSILSMKQVFRNFIRRKRYKSKFFVLIQSPESVMGCFKQNISLAKQLSWCTGQTASAPGSRSPPARPQWPGPLTWSCLLERGSCSNSSHSYRWLERC